MAPQPVTRTVAARITDRATTRRDGLNTALCCGNEGSVYLIVFRHRQMRRTGPHRLTRQIYEENVVVRLVNRG